MALQGTLDTFALPDVLRLLAATKKAGRLRVTGDGGSGSLWLDGGTVTGGELLVRGAQADTFTDVLFNLLRFAQGSFSFDAGSMPPSTGEAREVESLLVEAELMLGEWRSLALVVPSLDAWLSLAPELNGRDVVVDAARWRIIVTIGSGATVGEVGRRVGLGDLAVMRAVKEVIELGLVEVRDAAPLDAPHAEVAGGGAADLAAPASAVAPVADAIDLAIFDAAPVAPVPDVVVDDELELVDVDEDGDDVEDAVVEPPSVDELVIGEPSSAFAGSSIVFEPLGSDDDHTSAGFTAVEDTVADFAVEVPLYSRDTPIAPPSFTEMRSGLGAMSLSDEGRPEPARRGVSYDASADDPAEIARQLANLSPRAAKAVAAAAKATTEEEREAALATIEAEDETINRGVLLKFLGAVDS